MHTRGVVAMAGTFGYELNPGALTKDKKEEIKDQIACFKKNEALISRGDYYRLSNPFKDEYAAWMFVSENADEVLLSVVMLKMNGNMTVNYVKLKGLAADALYKDEETGRCYYGSALMEAGLPMPAELVEYPAYQFRFVRCQE